MQSNQNDQKIKKINKPDWNFVKILNSIKIIDYCL